jgi:hypothetical protein
VEEGREIVVPFTTFLTYKSYFTLLVISDLFEPGFVLVLDLNRGAVVQPQLAAVLDFRLLADTPPPDPFYDRLTFLLRASVGATTRCCRA